MDSSIQKDGHTQQALQEEEPQSSISEELLERIDELQDTNSMLRQQADIMKARIIELQLSESDSWTPSGSRFLRVFGSATSFSSASRDSSSSSLQLFTTDDDSNNEQYEEAEREGEEDKDKANFSQNIEKLHQRIIELVEEKVELVMEVEKLEYRLSKFILSNDQIHEQQLQQQQQETNDSFFSRLQSRVVTPSHSDESMESNSGKEDGHIQTLSSIAPTPRNSSSSILSFSSLRNINPLRQSGSNQEFSPMNDDWTISNQSDLLHYAMAQKMQQKRNSSLFSPILFGSGKKKAAKRIDLAKELHIMNERQHKQEQWEQRKLEREWEATKARTAMLDADQETEENFEGSNRGRTQLAVGGLSKQQAALLGV